MKKVRTNNKDNRRPAKIKRVVMNRTVTAISQKTT